MATRIFGPLVDEVKRQLCWHGIGPQRFSVSTFGTYSFICGGKTEYHRTVLYGGESFVLGAFLFLLRPQDVVWDVGASVGLFTVHAAGQCQVVVAFEPDPATFARLLDNVRTNGLEQRTTCRQAALGSEIGELMLQTDGLAGNAPALAPLHRHHGSVRVQGQTIDGTVGQGTPPPNVLKIDVEGAELAVLLGARELLRSEARPRVLFVEVHPKFLPSFGHSAEMVEQLILETGYHIVGGRSRQDQYHLVAVRSTEATLTSQTLTARGSSGTATNDP